MQIADPSPANDIPLLEVENLSIAFGGTTIVNNVSFSLGQGETLGIVGDRAAESR